MTDLFHYTDRRKPEASKPQKRWSIMVVEYGSNHEVELCQLDGDTAPVIAGLRAKTLHVGLSGKRRLTKIPKYSGIRVVDNRRGDRRE
jgi:hypothetical protein